MARIPNHLLPFDSKARKALLQLGKDSGSIEKQSISSPRSISGGGSVVANPVVLGNPLAIAAVADIDPGIPGRDIAVNPIRRR